MMQVLMKDEKKITLNEGTLYKNALSDRYYAMTGLVRIQVHQGCKRLRKQRRVWAAHVSTSPLQPAIAARAALNERLLSGSTAQPKLRPLLAPGILK